MPNRSRQKGDRFERTMVELLQGAGCEAQRVPLSGAAGGLFSDDITLTLPNGVDLRAECKARKEGAGFKTIEKWLGESDLLFLHRDRHTPMVVMNWLALLTLIEGLQRETPKDAVGREQGSL